MQKQTAIGATCKAHLWCTRCPMLLPLLPLRMLLLHRRKKIAKTEEMLLWRKNDQRRCNNGRALERLFLPLRMLRLHSSEEEAKADDVFLWHRHACTKTMQKQTAIGATCVRYCCLSCRCECCYCTVAKRMQKTDDMLLWRKCT